VTASGKQGCQDLPEQNEQREIQPGAKNEEDRVQDELWPFVCRSFIQLKLDASFVPRITIIE
jgi:hypothetical protein